MKETIATIFVGLVFFASLSCAKGQSDAVAAPSIESQGSLTVTGRLRDVGQSSFLGIGHLLVEDLDGNMWEFEGRDLVIPEFSPSHLRDHMLLNLAITVEYTEVDGALVIVSIIDLN